MYKSEKLPYSYDALEPYIDTHTLGLHKNKHQKKYLDKLNELLIKNNYYFKYSLEELPKHINEFNEEDKEDILFNLGGVINHNIYFNSMGPNKELPKTALMDEINNTFGSYEENVIQDDYYRTQTYGSNYVLPSTPTKYGYDFAGWNSQVDGSGTEITTSTIFNSTSNTNIFAMWNEKTGTIEYNANGHGTAPSNDTFTFTESYAVIYSISAENYKFTSWNTKANGSGTSYNKSLFHNMYTLDYLDSLDNQKELIYPYLEMEYSLDVFDRIMEKYPIEPSNHLVDILYEAIIYEGNKKECE